MTQNVFELYPLGMNSLAATWLNVVWALALKVHKNSYAIGPSGLFPAVSKADVLGKML